MRLAPVIARLQATVLALRGIYGALEAATPPAYPVAYVYPMQCSAEPDELLNGHDQRLTDRIAVEIQVKQVANAAAGGPAQDAIEDLRDAIQAALAGWTPEAGATPMDYAGGQLLGFDAGLATWREEFTTARRLRTVP